ncbi:MAG: DUF1499 domain-containing protein [Pontixanthobacter sp.]
MKILKMLPRIALILTILLLLWFAVAMFGAKIGLIGKLFAFGTMTIGIGVPAAMLVAVLAGIGLIAALLIKPRKGWLTALIALAVPLVVFFGVAQLRTQAASVPFIYDVTTNTVDAPMFSAALAKERTADENVLLDFNKPLGAYEKWAANPEVKDKTAAQLIAQGYPDLKTLTVEQSPEDAVTAIKDAMEMRGFRNVTVDEAAGTVEATAVVFWYGFEDEIIGRARKTDMGTEIDFRSTSRVGTSDLGVNAQRIMDLSAAVKDRLAKDFPKMKSDADATKVEQPKDAAPAAEPAPKG